MARVNDLVVFVPFAVPGDVVDLQVRRKKHSYCEAEIIRMVKPSGIRVEPLCAHFGVCGGCKWQNVPYAEQLKMKLSSAAATSAGLLRKRWPRALSIRR